MNERKMTKSLGPLRRKLWSPLANKQTHLDKGRGESEFMKVLKDDPSQSDSLYSAKTFASHSRSQVSLVSTSPSVAGTTSGVSGSCGPRTPSLLSPLGKRAHPETEMLPKPQRSTRVRDPKRIVRFAEDVLQMSEDDLKHSPTVLSSKKPLFLDIPLPANLPDIEPWGLSNPSIQQTIIGTVCEVHPPSLNQGLPLTIKKFSLNRFQSLLLPSTYTSYPGRKGISELPMSIILQLVQEPKSCNDSISDRNSTNEEYLPGEWSEDVSSVPVSTIEIENCVLESQEQSTLQMPYNNQLLEFQEIWSSKMLQMAEVAACMMHSDFQFLPLVV
ncbi:hypothetical protein R1flu_022937 [Riccia fluitans]|uniref:Uncharacterized protein n=1 Tax=Riccia fluitans TaxID=41844 RepID=A0ABD1XR46_9MARC